MTDEFRFVNYDSKYAADFARLNYFWIEKYFKVEEADRLYLDNPGPMIIEKGGDIIFILSGDSVVGTCALVKINADTYELAKMAVDPDFQGKGLGYTLGIAVLDRARELGARKVFLESNTILGPAIHLYEKLGFKRIEQAESPYERSNIQMEYRID